MIFFCGVLQINEALNRRKTMQISYQQFISGKLEEVTFHPLINRHSELLFKQKHANKSNVFDRLSKLPRPSDKTLKGNTEAKDSNGSVESNANAGFPREVVSFFPAPITTQKALASSLLYTSKIKKGFYERYKLNNKC